MSNTHALYLQEMWISECDSKVVRVEALASGVTSVVLDRTVFYPQGGGQLYDKGQITSGDARFEVLKVRQKYSYVPDFLPEDKSVRVITFGDTFGVSCGGTHVRNTAECRAIQVRKIKTSKNYLKISYEVKIMPHV